MIKKIEYENKVSIQNDESIENKNKVTDSDMNEIKEIVNNNANELSTVEKDINDIKSKNTEQDTNIDQLQENTETSSNKIAELEKELKEAQEDFYQNSIRGQASGEYIHVEDSSNCRSIIGIGGNHMQDGYPSPDHQSEIESVGSNVNLANKDNITNLYFNQNQISVGSTSKTMIENCLPNTTYTISKIKSTKFRVCTTNKTPQTNESIIDYIYNDNGDKITITTSDKAKYMCIYYYDSGTDTLEEQVILDSIKIEKGKVATPYSKYGQGCVKVTKCNKNLFDKDNAIKEYELDGTTGKIMSNSLYFTSDYIRVNPNGQYFLSGKQDGTSNCFYDKNKKYLTKVTLTNGLLTVPDNSDICYLRINARLTSIDTTMIEKGTERTDYVEGQSQTVIMPIQQEMLIGDYVADVEHHGWEKITITGNEYNWIENAVTKRTISNYVK